MKTWHVNYMGWRICHDPAGKLACYRLDGDALEWCYFGNTMREIKAKIYCREFFRDIERIQSEHNGTD